MELSKTRTRLLRRIAQRKGRETEGVVLVEGPRVIETALQHGADFLFVVHSDVGEVGAELLAHLAGRGVEVIGITSEQLQEFAQTETPQGILAVAREPRTAVPAPESARSDRVLVLDRIQDPGNVGTLIRAAAALAVDRVIFLDGTADPWSAKALRASTGLTFHIPLHGLGWAAASEWMGKAGLPLLVAHGPGEDVRSWLARGTSAEAHESGADDPSQGWVLLIGNEGEGPRTEALEKADALLSIPLVEGVESLNAAMAGAILLWALGPGRARTA